MRLVTLTVDIAAEIQVEDPFADPCMDVRLEDIASAVEQEIEQFVPTVVVKGRRVGHITRVACVRKSEQ